MLEDESYLGEIPFYTSKQGYIGSHYKQLIVHILLRRILKQNKLEM